MKPEKTIINYSTSGLGNRLRPLASCAAISKQSGRKLAIYWDNITPNGCLAKFDELFTNFIPTYSLTDLEHLNDCLLLTESGTQGHGMDRELIKFGRKSLKLLSYNNPYRHHDSFSFEDQNTNIIVYHNNFLPTVDLNEAHSFIASLRPIPKIQEKIDYYAGSLNLSKDVIGIHARGTDFGINVEEYIHEVYNILNRDPKKKIFLSTEDESFEKEFLNVFGDNLILRKKQFYVKRLSENRPWTDHNNFYITKSHAEEAVEDLYLLAKTRISIYNSISSFAEIAIILSKYY